MYHLDPQSQDSSSKALELLASVTDSPVEACEKDPEIQAAFDQSLRELAEDIIQYHPSLAHLLLGMGEAPCPSVHGQN